MMKYNTFANKGRAILRERMIVWISSMRTTEMNEEGISLTVVPFVMPNNLAVLRTLNALNIPLWYVPRSRPAVANANDTQNPITARKINPTPTLS